MMQKAFLSPSFFGGVSPTISAFFAPRSEHPLADPKEVKRIIAALPRTNPFKAVDELCGWLDSLHRADGLRINDYCNVVCQFDEAAQPHLRQLASDYLHARRLSKTDECRLWYINATYWGKISELYASCMARNQCGESLGAALPLVATRLLAAYATQLKWIEYRYGPVNHALWRAIGQIYLDADAAGYAQRSVRLYPNRSGATNIASQYLHALVLHASSPDSLSPLKIELVDRLVDYVLSCFIFSAEMRSDSVYWIDAAHDTPPSRLLRQPPKHSKPSLRFFSPGTAPEALQKMIYRVERGEMPEDLNLGKQYSTKVLLPVLRHLALYWAPKPPSRAHRRHVVSAQVAMLHGFENSLAIFSDGDAHQCALSNVLSGKLENVNLGGFSIGTDALLNDWFSVGSLLSMQPEGGDNWVLGVVQRYNKGSDGHVSIGVQSIAKQALRIELRSRASGLSLKRGIPGIWLREGNQPGEARLVLPTAGFDLRESLEFSHAGRDYLLTPIALESSGVDYEIARYREHVAD